MMMKRVYYTCLILFILNVTGKAQVITDDINQEIERRVQLEINPAISIGILLPTGEQSFYNYGVYDSQKSQPPDSLTLYEIGSITKTFTSTLLDMYHPDSLDAFLTDFLKDPGYSHLKKIRLSDIRNHLAGIPRLSPLFSPENWSDPFYGYSDSTLTIELQNVSPDTSGIWSYSNFGYAILGKILEKTTDESFVELMGSVFNNAGMTNTYPGHIYPPSNSLAEPTNIGTGNSYWNFTGPSRYAGGLISNTQDLLNYLSFQKTQNPLFKNGEVRNTIVTGIPDLGKDKLNYKDGWFVFTPHDNQYILFHNGGTGGFTSFLGYNLNTNTGVAVLSNSVSLVDDIGFKILYPDFNLNQPERTIAYELADNIDEGATDDLVQLYQNMSENNYPDNILDIYWLERYYFGTKKYSVSNQLSDIMLKVLPDDWEVWDIKGQNLEGLELFNRAKEAYQKALELNPDNVLLEAKIEKLSDK